MTALQHICSKLCVLKNARRLSLHVVITELTAFTQEPVGQSVGDTGQKDNAAMSKFRIDLHLF